MSSKSFWRRSVLQECLTKVSSKSVLHKCQESVSSKQCQVRVSYKRVKQECHARASNKKRCAIVSSKGVLQECHLSVSTQGVSQMGSLENVRNKYCLCSSTYVSAFGFVGFILFFFYNVSIYLPICLPTYL